MSQNNSLVEQLLLENQKEVNRLHGRFDSFEERMLGVLDVFSDTLKGFGHEITEEKKSVSVSTASLINSSFD